MNTPRKNLQKQRGRLAKALELADGRAIQVYKLELFQTLWQAGEDVDMERDTAADLIATADTLLEPGKHG